MKITAITLFFVAIVTQATTSTTTTRTTTTPIQGDDDDHTLLVTPTPPCAIVRLQPSLFAILDNAIREHLEIHTDREEQIMERLLTMAGQDQTLLWVIVGLSLGSNIVWMVGITIYHHCYSRVPRSHSYQLRPISSSSLRQIDEESNI
jgi:hypothetical protein